MAEIVVIVEGAADARIATRLAERVILEQVDWIEPYLQSMVAWTGFLPHSEYTCWKDLNVIYLEAARSGVRLPRYLGGDKHKSLKAYGAAARKVLHYIRRLSEDRTIRAVLLICDLDNQPERRVGLEQARTEHETYQPGIAVVIGTPNRKREAWVLNGFEVQDAAEQRILSQIISELGFDPCAEPHRLRAASRAEPERQRNAKVVLELLTAHDQEREVRCWEVTGLAVLRHRGIYTGLSDYISEVETRLLPAILNN